MTSSKYKKKSQLRILYTEKISFKNKGKIKIFSDKVERTYHQQIYTIRKVKCSLGKETLYRMDIWDLEKREEYWKQEHVDKYTTIFLIS